MSGKYGSNQWKVRLYYIICILITLFIIGGTGLFIKSKYDAYQVVKQEEARKQQRKKEEEAKKAKEEEEQRQKEEKEKKAKEEERRKKEEEKRAVEEAEKKIDSEYEVVRSDATWMDASEQAESRGGHLAVVNSQEEEKKIQALIEQQGSIHTVWLGGILKKESFQWVNGEEFNYTNWGPGEPNNETGDEFYLDMYQVDGVWYWNDAPNDIKHFYTGRMGYVIEWETE